MSAQTPIEVATTAIAEQREKCQVVVLYEGPVAHHTALGVCERLGMQFGSDVDFEFKSWRFAGLADSDLSQQAIAAAIRADVILVATHGDDLPIEVRDWLERCSRQREKTEGAICVLFAEPISFSSSIGSVLSRLKSAALQLKMDFLPLIPQQTRKAIEAIDHRESKLSALFSDVLPQRPSSHYGLND